MNYCFFNDSIIPFEECNIHVSDLGLQRGYAVFEFFRSRNGVLLWIDDYLDRLENSLHKARIKSPLSREELKSKIFEIHQLNKIPESFFKILVTGGYSSDMASVDSNPNLVIINKPFRKGEASLYERGQNLITHQFIRPDHEIKSTNYMNSVRLDEEKRRQEAVDVLYYDEYIRETSRANIFFVKDEVVYTAGQQVLKGITRKKVLSLMDLNRIEYELESIPAADRYSYDEVFITSSSKDIMPIVKIDDMRIGSGRVGELTIKLMELFKKSYNDS